MLCSRPLGMLVLVVGLLVLGSPPSCATADDVQELVRQRLEVNNLILAKQYAQAKTAGKRFVEFTESKFVDDPAARVMASRSWRLCTKSCSRRPLAMHCRVAK